MSASDRAGASSPSMRPSVGECIRLVSDTWISNPEAFSESDINGVREIHHKQCEYHRLQFCPVVDASTVTNMGNTDEGRDVIDALEPNAVQLHQLYTTYHERFPSELLLPDDDATPVTAITPCRYLVRFPNLCHEFRHSHVSNQRIREYLCTTAGGQQDLEAAGLIAISTEGHDGAANVNYWIVDKSHYDRVMHHNKNKFSVDIMNRIYYEIDHLDPKQYHGNADILTCADVLCNRALVPRWLNSTRQFVDGYGPAKIAYIGVVGHQIYRLYKIGLSAGKTIDVLKALDTLFTQDTCIRDDIFSDVWKAIGYKRQWPCASTMSRLAIRGFSSNAVADRRTQSLHKRRRNEVQTVMRTEEASSSSSVLLRDDDDSDVRFEDITHDPRKKPATAPSASAVTASAAATVPQESSADDVTAMQLDSSPPTAAALDDDDDERVGIDRGWDAPMADVPTVPVTPEIDEYVKVDLTNLKTFSSVCPAAARGVSIARQLHGPLMFDAPSHSHHVALGVANDTIMMFKTLAIAKEKLLSSGCPSEIVERWFSDAVCEVVHWHLRKTDGVYMEVFGKTANNRPAACMMWQTTRRLLTNIAGATYGDASSSSVLIDGSGGTANVGVVFDIGLPIHSADTQRCVVSPYGSYIQKMTSFYTELGVTNQHLSAILAVHYHTFEGLRPGYDREVILFSGDADTSTHLLDLVLQLYNRKFDTSDTPKYPTGTDRDLFVGWKCGKAVRGGVSIDTEKTPPRLNPNPGSEALCGTAWMVFNNSSVFGDAYIPGDVVTSDTKILTTRLLITKGHPTANYRAKLADKVNRNTADWLSVIHGLVHMTLSAIKDVPQLHPSNAEYADSAWAYLDDHFQQHYGVPCPDHRVRSKRKWLGLVMAIEAAVVTVFGFKETSVLFPDGLPTRGKGGRLRLKAFSITQLFPVIQLACYEAEVVAMAWSMSLDKCVSTAPDMHRILSALGDRQGVKKSDDGNGAASAVPYPVRRYVLIWTDNTPCGGKLSTDRKMSGTGSRFRQDFDLVKGELSFKTNIPATCIGDRLVEFESIVNPSRVHVNNSDASVTTNPEFAACTHPIVIESSNGCRRMSIDVAWFKKRMSFDDEMRTYLGTVPGIRLDSSASRVKCAIRDIEADSPLLCETPTDQQIDGFISTIEWAPHESSEMSTMYMTLMANKHFTHSDPTFMDELCSLFPGCFPDRAAIALPEMSTRFQSQSRHLLSSVRGCTITGPSMPLPRSDWRRQLIESKQQQGMISRDKSGWLMRLLLADTGTGLVAHGVRLMSRNLGGCDNSRVDTAHVKPFLNAATVLDTIKRLRSRSVFGGLPSTTATEDSIKATTATEYERITVGRLLAERYKQLTKTPPVQIPQPMHEPETKSYLRGRAAFHR